MKNIFFITELFYPNKTSTAYIMTEIAKHFTSRRNVSVICSAAAYDENVSSIPEEGIEKMNMILCETPKVDKNKSLSRILGAMRVTLSFAGKILKYVKKDDTVFAVTNPFLLVLLLAVLKPIKKFKYKLLVHDVFPENAVPAGVLSNTSLMYKITKKLYDWAYSQADDLVVLGRDMQELVISKSNKPNNVHVVENWYDSDLNFEPNFDRNAYLGFNVDGKIIIGFGGNIGRVQKVLDFVKTFSKVKNDKLIVLIVGEGAERKDVIDFVESNNMKNVFTLGPKNRNEQSMFLNCFDIGLISLASNMYGLGVPSKSYNLLYLGKPLLFIGDKESEIDLLVREKSVGRSFTWEEEKELISYLNSLESVDEVQSNNARRLAAEEYNEKVILSKLDNII